MKPDFCRLGFFCAPFYECPLLPWKFDAMRKPTDQQVFWEFMELFGKARGWLQIKDQVTPNTTTICILLKQFYAYM